MWDIVSRDPCWKVYYPVYLSEIFEYNWRPVQCTHLPPLRCLQHGLHLHPSDRFQFASKECWVGQPNSISRFSLAGMPSSQSATSTHTILEHLSPPLSIICIAPPAAFLSSTPLNCFSLSRSFLVKSIRNHEIQWLCTKTKVTLL